MSRTKYLFLRGLAITLQILRFLVMAISVLYVIMTVLYFFEKHSKSLFDGTFHAGLIDPRTFGCCVGALLLAVAFLFLGRPLDKMRSYANGYIDDFADTAAYSRKKGLKKGELDAQGNMITGLKLMRGSAHPTKELEALIGLCSVKEEIRKLHAVFLYEKINKANSGKKFCKHYAFLGAPGTGKTTVARIFAGLLYQNKQIKRNAYLECTGNDLTGEYMGQTKTKVDAIYNMAKGGVIFIDEAYALCSTSGPSEVADEAVSQLLVHMESDPYTVIIFAGYDEPMKRFFSINSGLTSRISRQIKFQNYNVEELLAIFKKFAEEKKMALDCNAEYKLLSIFQRKLEIVDTLGCNFSNGRYVRNCFNEIYQQHAVNEVVNREAGNGKFSNVITKEDITCIESDLMLLE